MLHERASLYYDESPNTKKVTKNFASQSIKNTIEVIQLSGSRGRKIAKLWKSIIFFTAALALLFATLQTYGVVEQLYSYEISNNCKD